jgi:hypothetical protein
VGAGVNHSLMESSVTASSAHPSTIESRDVLVNQIPGALTNPVAGFVG